MDEWKDKAQGKGEEIKGKVTGDKPEEMKGKARQTWGEAEGAANDMKERVESSANDEYAGTTSGTRSQDTKP